jgi:Xaa-Pro aminopeptidase
MHNPNTEEVRAKHSRVLAFLDAYGYDAMILERQDDFAWYTGGSSNQVVIGSDMGFGLLLITPKKTFLVAQVMDGPRLMQEELSGLTLEPVFTRWYEKGREEKAAELTKGMRVIADVPMPGADYSLGAIQALHYPLTDSEICKYRRLGALTEEVLTKVATEIKPGMSELDVEAMLLYEYARREVATAVLLIGADDRIVQFRHPTPSKRKIARFVLIHPAVRKEGLHANVTRMVHFGDSIPEDTLQRYEAACKVEAAAVCQCLPGTRFCDIFEEQKRVYQSCGYPEEWRNHFQGGITGYLLIDPARCLSQEAKVGLNQAFDWFITITGVKVEELSITAEHGPEVISASGLWPAKEYEANGRKIRLPQILVR